MAMIPFGELRVSIPFAMGIYEMGATQAFFLSAIGNMLPVVPLLLFLVAGVIIAGTIVTLSCMGVFERTSVVSNREKMR